MRRRAVLAFGIVVAIGASAQVTGPIGLWGVEKEWGDLPKEYLEANGGPPEVKPGVVVNFCANHQLKIATGVLYRGGGRVGLGASDGLTLYDGTWSQRGSSIEVKYRLVDAEIEFPNMKRLKLLVITERLNLAGGTLRFAFHRPDQARGSELVFNLGRLGDDEIIDEFVECKE